MKYDKRVYVNIHLDAIQENLMEIKRHLPLDTNLMGIVKADGYGHGSVPIACAIAPFVTSYGVATADEALILRHHGVEKPILILGVTHPERYEELLNAQISFTIFTIEQGRTLSTICETTRQTASIHIAVDTGMSRIGMMPDETHADEVVAIGQLPGIKIEGVFTHFAKADEIDKTSAQKQLKTYLDFIEQLNQGGIHIPIKHCANSAGIIELPESHLNTVRAGIAMYGLYPSDQVKTTTVTLQPALQWKTMISYVKTIEPGREVSYGGTFVAEKEMRVATIPVGYGDGYSRALSGCGHVLIHGKPAKILGRICMDQFMVDITGIPNAKEYDTVTLIGTDGDQHISVEEMARLCDGFHYEIICNISKRVPRVYWYKNDIIGIKNSFEEKFQGFCGKILG